MKTIVYRAGKTRLRTPAVTASRLQRVLARLGRHTPQEIAYLLASRGITGRPNAAMACPLHNLLQAYVPPCVISIGLGSTLVRILEQPWCFPHPPTVASFVSRFDDGSFPYLAERREV